MEDLELKEIKNDAEKKQDQSMYKSGITCLIIFLITFIIVSLLLLSHFMRD